MISAVLWVIFILPIASLFLLNQEVIKRYLPAALFVTVLNSILYEIAWEENWWRYQITLFNWDKIAPVHIVYSSYWVVTIWILYFTFQKFWLYAVVNIIADFLFVFTISAWMKHVGVFTGDMPMFMTGLLFISMAMLIYIFQRWYENKN
ncbi:hypothetical protein [Lentibacillus cibarius]|uniref:Uncharacterized protein n=1 Tax=Lentibacillus cibarius TaxID=2583219 RepID=A0A5S3QI95_9BACI|nr:hypothetical protein [Lentibacillus cibarius]TMN21624.1 hypothetical protein FFL34_05500 [Lentibacillus cibarius]